MLNLFEKKRAQVTIFIIIALLAIAGVALYFVLTSEEVSQENLSPELREPENAFLSCINTEAQAGIDLLKSNAGYIESPEFEPGSKNMPFSSHLSFAGSSVPYWHYISGNGFERENVPSKDFMESQLEDFIEEQVDENCNLQEVREGEYQIRRGSEINTEASISEDAVEVTLEQDLAIKRNDQSAVVEQHDQTINTNLGGLYDSAKEVYQYEREENFLEDYGVDVLNSYAPVAGLEFSCKPKTWNANQVFDELESAVQANTLALRNSGSSDDYFNIDLPVSKRVRFLNYGSWPSTYKVEPSEGSAMVAEPIGDERGLSSMGFCFVSYQFSYDMKYPVMVRVSEGGETFQFPLGVVIENNVARGNVNGTLGTENNETDINFCQDKNANGKVNVRDLDGDPINASISYSCFGQSCSLGETSSGGEIQTRFPQCVNGFVNVKADGYKTTSEKFSTVSGNNSLTVYMKELHNLNVELQVDSEEYQDDAVISFVSEDDSNTVIYPDQENLSLSAGTYNITARAFENVSLNLEDSTSQQCVDVPTGVPGVSEERCFDLNVSSGVASRALTAGGSSEKVFLDSDLKNSDSIVLNTESLPKPESIEGLRSNYEKFESKSMDVELE